MSQDERKPPVCPYHDQPMVPAGNTDDIPPWTVFRCIVTACRITHERPPANLQSILPPEDEAL